MKISVGSDFANHFTDEIVAYVKEKGIETVACGALAGKQADYVDAASEVAEKVSSGECEYGILFCTTGTGVTIIANKFKGVRAAMCYDAFSAEIAKLANNANVLSLSFRYTGERLAKEIVDKWLSTAPSTEPKRMSFHRKTDELDGRNFKG